MEPVSEHVPEDGLVSFITLPADCSRRGRSISRSVVHWLVHSVPAVNPPHHYETKNVSIFLKNSGSEIDSDKELFCLLEVCFVL